MSTLNFERMNRMEEERGYGIMGGKYEVRYYTENNYRSEYTNSWFHFMKLRLTKKVIYYKVIK